MRITTEDLANACPENHDFARVIWGLERLCGGGGAVGWPQSRRGQGDMLNQCLDARKRENNCDDSLARRISGRDYQVGGDEHHLISLPDSPDRIFKITHSDSFGCRIRLFREDPDLSGKHFIPEVNDDPFLYLRRWMILNALSSYRTRFEGILAPQGILQVPRFCVSQFLLPESHIRPESAVIAKALRLYGFARIALDTYVNADALILADAAPRNVRVVNGDPVPFDVIAEYASPDIREWISERGIVSLNPEHDSEESTRHD